VRGRNDGFAVIIDLAAFALEAFNPLGDFQVRLKILGVDAGLDAGLGSSAGRLGTRTSATGAPHHCQNRDEDQATE